jgi:uncharacterized protein YjbJ (UPF0337 family)
MNREQIEGKLQQFKGDMRSTWGKLTSDDLSEIGGRVEDLVGKLVQRYGMKKEQAEKQIDEWVHKLEEKVKGMKGSSGEGSSDDPQTRH